MSVVLRLPISDVALLPLAAAVAVAEVAGPAARVKWPNDVLLPGPRPGVVDDAAADGEEPVARRKVAGILCEGRPQDGWVVAGIGVNVAVRLDDLPVDLRPTAATLARDPADVDVVLGDVLRALRDALSAPAATLLDAWRARDGLRGRTVTWSGGTGTADGIDGAGRLVVLLPDGGRTALDAGEVHLGRGPGAAGPD